MVWKLKYKFFLFFGLISFQFHVKAQVQLAFQGGEPGNSWSYTSSGADATAQAQAVIANNIVAGTKSIVVGGNTSGGSCIDGGGGNGPSVARLFNFSPIDITSSNNFIRTLSFHWGSRYPICVGTGWDSGENLVFTAFYDGVGQPPITIASGGNNANFNIQSFSFTHSIPQCVNSFHFNISLTTNRRDELLFLDNVTLSTPQLNNAPIQVNLTICESQLPYSWNGLLFLQAGSQVQTLTNSFGCDSLVQYNLNVVAPTVPNFGSFGPFCSGQSIQPLPSMSQNNIPGTWSPSINNQQTSTYTFIPASGLCASSITQTIVINQNITPLFAPVGTICAGAASPNFPLQSQNNVSGSWSPPFNNSTTTTYTFSPSLGQCAITTQMTVGVIPNITPTFGPINDFCAGANIANLPNSSTNNIQGTWAPAINNLQTTTYTFTPISGICAVPTTLSITIIPNQVPLFNAPGAFCPNANIPDLPTESINNIAGSWSPVINNQQTTTYTFTPSLGVCATNATLTIAVNLSLAPVFNFPLNYCVGDSIETLPILSTNNILGNWSPAVNNQQTTTYTFTPLANQCALPVDITINIYNFVTPQFTPISQFCSGTYIPELPITSINDIAGIWTPAINNTTTTLYTFTPDIIQTSGNPCALTVELTINIIPGVTPIFVETQPICQGTAIPSLPTISLNEIAGFWSPSLNNQQTTTYTFTPTSGTCSESVTRTIQVLPLDTTIFNVTICEGQLPYLWQGMSITNAGSYFKDYSDNLGCTATDVLNLQVLPDVSINLTTTVCLSEFPYLYAGQNITMPGLYEWTTNNPSGCDTIFILLVNAFETEVLSFDQNPISSCNETVLLNIGLQGSPSLTSCSWSINSQFSNNCGNFSVEISEVGCYDLLFLGIDQNGCEAELEQQNMICIYPNPIASFTLEDNFLDSYEVFYPSNQSIGADSFIWNFGSEGNPVLTSNPQYSYEQSGDFEISLTAINEFGCSNEYKTIVRVEDVVLIYIPNTFTPGGNDQNELFKPIITSGVNRENYKLTIYNRWGEILFESQNPDIGWDGTYGSKICPSEVYVWKIEYENTQGINDQKQGHLNLLR